MDGGNRIDFESINRMALADLDSLVRQWAPQGELNGREWTAINPVRGDKNPGSFKINVSTGIWSDFADDASGSDPISLYAYLFTNDQQAVAARELGQMLGANDNEARPALSQVTADTLPRKTRDDDVFAISPTPDDAPAPKNAFPYKDSAGKWGGHPITAKWPYHDAEGRVIGYACRADMSASRGEGAKDVYVQRWNPSEGAWRFKQFPKPRPLQGLDLLAARPDDPVLVVEGEKTREAAEKLLPGYVCVTWPGGTKAIQFVDWSILEGRQVTIWPDNDEPGRAAAHGYYGRGGDWRHGIGGYLQGVAASVDVVDAPDGVPDGWDLADVQEWGEFEICDHIASHSGPPKIPEAQEPPFANDSEMPPMAPLPTDDEEPIPGDQNSIENWPFRMLGHDGETYYYLDNEGLRVRRLSVAGHTKSNLLALAHKGWWEALWPTKGGADWDMAVNALFRYQHGIGIYDPANIRGRGAWYEDGRVVLHLGDQLLVDGVPTKIHEHRTRYIYESGVRNDMTAGHGPLTRDRVSRLTELVRMLSWDNPADADLLLGWCFGAVVCGAMPWRPHIWIIGPTGSGKSWIYDHIIWELLGDWAMPAQSSTTEAGLRQSLGLDSRPLIFDEAEAEDKKAQDRMKTILDLMRQASSEHGAPIIKGSATGKAQEFHIRSMFAFSSINASATQAADLNRLAVLSLHRNSQAGAAEKFEEIKRRWADLFSNDFAPSFRALAVSRVALIRRVQDYFARAASERFGNRRLGDQYGTLLACAWAMTAEEDADMTLDEARRIINAYEWGDDAGMDETDEDESRCLQKLMQSPMRVEVKEPETGRQTQVTRTVGELVMVASGRERDSNEAALTSRTADEHLRRCGMGMAGDMLAVSDSHDWIKGKLDNTPWAAGWGTLLARIEGARRQASFRFSGTRTRAVLVPVSEIVDAPAKPEDFDPPF